MGEVPLYTLDPRSRWKRLRDHLAAQVRSANLSHVAPLSLTTFLPPARPAPPPNAKGACPQANWVEERVEKQNCQPSG